MHCSAQYLNPFAQAALTVIIVIAVAFVRVEGPLQSSGSEVEFVERLNIAELYVEGLDAPYNNELQRLDMLCRNRQDVQACRQGNLRRFAVRVGSVHSGPSVTSSIVGELHAVLAFHRQYDLGYRLEFRPQGARAKAAVWLATIGDWGYGIEVPGVRVRGPWIKLIGAPFPAASWVDVSSLGANTGSIEGRLITVPSVPAIWPDGAMRSIAPGSYLVERIRGSEITVRAEVPTDFPCGEEVKAPEVMPPSVRIAARNLFSPRGEALFSETYGRGC